MADEAIKSDDALSNDANSASHDQSEPQPQGNQNDSGEATDSGGKDEQGSQSNRADQSGRSRQQRPGRVMLVRYGKMGMLGLYRHSEREIPLNTRHVVVQTERGLEIGEIVSPYFHHRGSCDLGADRIEGYCKQVGGNYPLSRKGRFVRFATSQDLNEQRHLEIQAKREGEYCTELIGKHKLPMELVDVEHLFGGDRIIYYFMADGRVDFRQLVKELAHEYQTRIEMRQVGARDEARLVADFETCGRECCCKSFLKVLQPVNMRMAKLQKATLDPSKISGRCGRLKCCLRYEDEVYTTLKKRLPRNNSTVLTDQGPGVIIEGQVLTQLVKVRLQSGPIIAVAVDELLERDYKIPDEPPPPQNSAGGSGQGRRDGRGRRDRTERPPRRDQRSRNGAGRDTAEPAEQEPRPDNASQQEGDGSAPKKRRRRRRRRKPGSGGNDPQGDAPGGNNMPPAGQ